MLARKHYAKRNNNGSFSNSVSVSNSTSTRINHLKKQIDPTNFKRVPENNMGNYIIDKKAELMKCQGIPNGTNSTIIDPENINGKGTGCNIVHNLNRKTQGDYKKENLYCILPENLQKPMIDNVICGAK